MAFCSFYEFVGIHHSNSSGRNVVVHVNIVIFDRITTEDRKLNKALIMILSLKWMKTLWEKEKLMITNVFKTIHHHGLYNWDCLLTLS